RRIGRLAAASGTRRKKLRAGLIMCSGSVMSDQPEHMTASSERTAIAEPLARLIAVFQQHLAGVHFPGADAAVLGEAAERVRAAAGELAEAEALVDAARAVLREAEEELLHKGQRALAYARIYAEEAPVLAAALEGIALPRVAVVAGEAGAGSSS